ncbi:MAG TPA: GNAT family protein [Anaerolineae bacterium]
MVPEIIKTERLILRPYTLRDVEAVLVMASDPEWARYLPVPQPYTVVDAEQFIAQQLLLDRAAQQAWAIEQNGTLIGGINIRFDFENHVGEVGYSLARPRWGQGLMTEAAGAVIEAAFSMYPELNRIRAMADSRNGASLRVMAKLGLAREGVLRQNRFIRGEFIDEVWCGLLRSEWEAQNQ